MNKKQKILTILALAAFGVIIASHYGGMWFYYGKLFPEISSTHPWIEDVHMPLFVLAVFYTGLFFLMSTRKG